MQQNGRATSTGSQLINTEIIIHAMATSVNNIQKMQNMRSKWTA